jgi:hypothetical protein
MKPCQKLKGKIEDIEQRKDNSENNRYRYRWLVEDLKLMEQYCKLKKGECPSKPCNSILRLHEIVYENEVKIDETK